jgi:hypothetical protein
VNCWRSKRAFLRACIAVSERVWAVLPTSAPTGQEASWEALWCKLSRPAVGWAFAYGPDGMPRFLRPGVRADQPDLQAGRDFFASRAEVSTSKHIQRAHSTRASPHVHEQAPPHRRPMPRSSLAS